MHGRICVSVAPFTGAWIEIKAEDARVRKLLSLPSRERGLKFDQAHLVGADGASLPSRERGLKLEVDITPLPTTGRSLHGSVD